MPPSRSAWKTIDVFYFEIGKARYDLNFIVGEILDYLPLARTIRKIIDDLNFQIREVFDYLNLIIRKALNQLDVSVDSSDRNFRHLPPHNLDEFFRMRRHSAV